MRSNLIISATMLSCAAIAEAAERPNIIVILADDMGYGDVSYFDARSKIQTTNLDRMASEGVHFTDAHSCSSVSSPTRYGILTGRYSWRSELTTGVLNGYSPAMIAPDRATIATMLSGVGYRTGFVGKWNMGWGWVSKDGEAPKYDANTMEMDNVDYTKKITNGPTTRGFDYSFGLCGSLDMPPYVYIENDVPTSVPTKLTSEYVSADGTVVTWRKGPTADDFDHEGTLPLFFDKANKFIAESAQEEQPFFLYLPLSAPHGPIVPSEEYLGKSGIGRYGDFALMVDDLIGGLFETIKESGIDDDTIVVFTTNNGCSPIVKFDELRELGHIPNSIYRGYKADLYDGGHRVPTIMRWGGRLKPHEVSQTICSTDLYATFADIVGYELPDNEAVDSYSLLPAIKGKRDSRPIREATVHHSLPGEFAIRQGDWKLLLSSSSGGWSDPRPADAKLMPELPPMQLFNMKSDPSEQNNLYDKYPEKVAELTQLLIEYVESGRSTPGAPQKNDKEHWGKLDYFM